MTKDEKKHLSKVAELGCIACRQMGIYDTPAEIHHIKNNFSLGKKSSHYEVIPLCHAHHRTSNEAYHYSPKKFTEKFGTQKELLTMVQELLD
tara:strand:+ start:784 stop:1059 length:276 start_codon:yes stop_codon:yes gene_type:complete